MAEFGSIERQLAKVMNKRTSDAAVMYVGRVLLFAMSILLALSWLIAPDLIATERNRLAALVNVQPEHPNDLFSVSVPSSNAPRVSSPFRPIASSSVDPSAVN